MSSPVLRVRRLDPKAALPTRASAGAAGFDLACSEEVWLPSGGQAVARTGLALGLPPGHYGRIAERSGLALRSGVGVGGGVIDSDYTGEVRVILYSRGGPGVLFAAGDRVAQLIVEACAAPRVLEVADLGQTARGAGGFGSTGVSGVPGAAGSAVPEGGAAGGGAAEGLGPHGMAMCVSAFRLRAGVRLPAPCTLGCSRLSLFCPERFSLVEVPSDPGAFSDQAFIPTGLVFGLPAGFQGHVRAPCAWRSDRGFRVTRTPVLQGEEVIICVDNCGEGPLVFEAGEVLAELVLELSAPPGVLEAARPAAPASAGCIVVAHGGENQEDGFCDADRHGFEGW